jgi:hypothetical protein
VCTHIFDNWAESKSFPTETNHDHEVEMSDTSDTVFHHTTMSASRSIITTATKLPSRCSRAQLSRSAHSPSLSVTNCSRRQLKAMGRIANFEQIRCMSSAPMPGVGGGSAKQGFRVSHLFGGLVGLGMLVTIYGLYVKLSSSPQLPSQWIVREIDRVDSITTILYRAGQSLFGPH